MNYFNLNWFNVDLTSGYIISMLIGMALCNIWSSFLKWKDRNYILMNEKDLTYKRILDLHQHAKDYFSPDKLAASLLYKRTSEAFAIFLNKTLNILNFGCLLFGAIPFVFNIFYSYLKFNVLASSFCVYIIFSLALNLIDIPFSFYSMFNIEARFGFNTTTTSLFKQDKIKSYLIDIIFTGILMSIGFNAVKLYEYYFPGINNGSYNTVNVNIWLCLGVTIFTSFFSILAEIFEIKVIMPLFNKFTPLDDGQFKDKVLELLKKFNFNSDGIYIMDASKRSRHSNAFCTGWGRNKRIVLFDTLFKKFTDDEILVIIGHELGHAKLHHLIINRVLSAINIFIVIAFICFFINDIRLYWSFGWNFVSTKNISEFTLIGIFLLTQIYNEFSWILTGIFSKISRKHEFEADAYACKYIGSKEPMITSLFKLYEENMSYPINDPLYENWYFSHPGLVNRIEALKQINQNEIKQ